MRTQIRKHNTRYLKGIALLRSCFGEQPTGLIFAQLIESLIPTANELAAYNSKVRKTSIDLNDLYEFLKKEVACNELLAIRSYSAYTFHKDHIRLVITGLDLWSHESALAVSMKYMLLTKYGSHPSTQHNNERLVKISSII